MKFAKPSATEGSECIPCSVTSLIQAILNVDKKFLYEMPVVPETEDESVTVYLERTFCYELYKQWTILLEGSGLRLAPEIDKELWNEYSKTAQSDKAVKRYPDFVLHVSQSDVEEQCLVVEVKRSSASKDDIKNDFEKLDYMVSDDFKFKGKNAKFENAVFLYIGKDGSNLELANINVGHGDKIWILQYDGENVSCNNVNNFKQQ